MRLGPIVCVLTLALISATAAAQPAGFVLESYGPTGQWGQVTGITFQADGTGWIWEKSGKVWKVVNGVKVGRGGATGAGAVPIIDISEEVGDWRDLGMLGFALDPNFAINGRVYLMYTVDYHHLKWFGTPQYSPATDEYFKDTIGRITRYTLDAGEQFTEVVAGSRTILVGETMQTGLPMCFQSHSVGSLVFGSDGTLLASNGDGASFDDVDTGGFRFGSSNTALTDGIISTKEDVGALRAQLVDSLSGKIIRIDPETGNGVASNPFFDATSPRAARSRVWAMGMRNPFRFTRRPATGSGNPADADPGVLYIGDVGWSTAEELNIAKSVGGGLNFGWPLFEGTRPQVYYPAATCYNLDAPNPLAGVNGCPSHLQFKDLLVQEVGPGGVLSWPNPCDLSSPPGQQVGPGLNGARPMVHTRPRADWRSARAARVPVFNGAAAGDIGIGVPGSPVSGYGSFGGTSSIGGIWFSGAAGNWPGEWRNTYFHGDYSGFWIHNFVFDAQDNLTQVREFLGASGITVVSMAENPTDGNLYFVAYSYFSASGVVYRVRYSPESPPVAAVSADVEYGPTPLTVEFTSAGSFDVNGPIAAYLWDFGDGSPVGESADVMHVYKPQVDVTAQGTIVARVLELSPPGPLGPGNPDPEVIRDGVKPAQSSTDRMLAFDTFHNGEQGTVDWIGYIFASVRRFNRVEMIEGVQASDGGWLTQTKIQVRINGVWTDVPTAAGYPEYDPLNGVNFEPANWTFAPVEGDGIRVYGRPGGVGRYFGVGELRVFAEPPAGENAPPRRYDVTLTVYDSVFQAASAVVSVWTDNTPPSVTVSSPVDGSTYCVSQPTAVPLTAVIGDAEQGATGVSCEWQVILRHNEHTHPEAAQPTCEGVGVIENHGADGDMVYFDFILTATDSLGLKSVRTVSMFPECCPADFNLSETVSVQDIFDFLAAYFAGDFRADFNHVGGLTVQDLFDFLAAYFTPC